MEKEVKHMADKLILGIFSDRDHAEDAINDLEDAGFNAKDISIVMQDKHEGKDIADNTGANVAGGAVSGATTGGVVGGLAGLLIGIGAIAVPGIGALLIGGPLAAALGLSGAAATTISGAATGALAGSLIGALMGLGVSEDDARVYDERIRAGGILVAIPASTDKNASVSTILQDNGADQVRTINFDEQKTIAHS